MANLCNCIQPSYISINLCYESFVMTANGVRSTVHQLVVHFRVQIPVDIIRSIHLSDTLR